MLLSCIAIGLSGFVFWQNSREAARMTELRSELATRLEASDSTQGVLRTTVRQQQDANTALQKKLEALQTQIDVREGQAVALDALYQEFSRTREERVLTEVEQAVMIAVQQLQLAGNLEAALIALQGAEARLAMSDHGQFGLLYKALGKDIERLKQTPNVNVSDAAQRLERLLESVDSLPLAFASELPQKAAVPGQAETDVSVAPEASDGYLARAGVFIKEMGKDLWGEVKGLVRVERIDHQSDPVLLAPSQSAFLRENLKIRLLTARLALLARDGRTYKADIEQAERWIERFFDINDEKVKVALGDLKVLQGLPVSAELPSLTESLAALRVLQTRPSPVKAVGQQSKPLSSPQAVDNMTAPQP